MTRSNACSPTEITEISVGNRKTLDMQTIAQKRKSEDGLINGNNPKSLKPDILLLDVYTQTDSITTDVTMITIFDLVKTNAERLNRVEDLMTKLCDMIGAFAETTSPQITASQEKKCNESCPTSILSQTSGDNQRFSTTSGKATSTDFITQAPQQCLSSSWDDINFTCENTPIANTVREDKSPEPTSSKMNLNNGNSTRDNLASLGCWLGNPNDANCRAWFSGDPNIIANCEAYGTNPVKLALGMTEALFTREEMAASNVRGTRGKESLDPNKINSIRVHVDYKFPLEKDRMEVRWQLIKPKIDSKCRQQRRQQHEHKWKIVKMLNSKSSPKTHANVGRPKKIALGDEEREILLYGSTKKVLNVYTSETNVETNALANSHDYLNENENEDKEGLKIANTSKFS
ncbi:uncharacterized protein LOC124453168 isoform X2 [Xenia sp. Carnegie-2017]|uniref:uncharacterized protein LOC124453168 isoform X2 n=1 Tax=Xenia sp. Carnegie-2017 TaxID=2897299 RepID=UPI001F0350BD|nr:uncharacterized protein LOC124453168 isoform X2 [Xenia sp. Carnegie-2017]